MDATITLGNILSVFVTICAVTASFWRVSVRFARLEAQFEMKIEMMWEDYCRRYGIGKNTNDPPAR